MHTFKDIQIICGFVLYSSTLTCPWQMWIFSNVDFFKREFLKCEFLIKMVFSVENIFCRIYPKMTFWGGKSAIYLMYCKNSIHSLTSHESNMTLMTSQSWTRCTLALCDTGTKYQVKLSRVYPVCKFHDGFKGDIN